MTPLILTSFAIFVDRTTWWIWCMGGYHLCTRLISQTDVLYIIPSANSLLFYLVTLQAYITFQHLSLRGVSKWTGSFERYVYFASPLQMIAAGLLYMTCHHWANPIPLVCITGLFGLSQREHLALMRTSLDKAEWYVVISILSAVTPALINSVPILYVPMEHQAFGIIGLNALLMVLCVATSCSPRRYFALSPSALDYPCGQITNSSIMYRIFTHETLLLAPVIAANAWFTVRALTYEEATWVDNLLPAITAIPAFLIQLVFRPLRERRAPFSHYALSALLVGAVVFLVLLLCDLPWYFFYVPYSVLLSLLTTHSIYEVTARVDDRKESIIQDINSPSNSCFSAQDVLDISLARYIAAVAAWVAGFYACLGPIPLVLGSTAVVTSFSKVEHEPENQGPSV
jgi:hypothetical protein